jgi:hypothetical protein
MGGVTHRGPSGDKITLVLRWGQVRKWGAGFSTPPTVCVVGTRGHMAQTTCDTTSHGSHLKAHPSVPALTGTRPSA